MSELISFNRIISILSALMFEVIMFALLGFFFLSWFRYYMVYAIFARNWGVGRARVGSKRGLLGIETFPMCLSVCMQFCLYTFVVKSISQRLFSVNLIILCHIKCLMCVRVCACVWARAYPFVCMFRVYTYDCVGCIRM